MRFVDNDRWSGPFRSSGMPDTNTHRGWRDPFATWRNEVEKKRARRADVALEIIEGLASSPAPRRRRRGGRRTRPLATLLAAAEGRARTGRSARHPARRGRCTLVDRYGERERISRATSRPGADRRSDRRGAVLGLVRALPAVAVGRPERHGTFDDVIARLPYVRDLGFDVLYFPPIHPIGADQPEGPEQQPEAAARRPGQRLRDRLPPKAATTRSIPNSARWRIPPAGRAADEHGLEIALDFAIQCSPDHPWIKEHPEWFDWRPDGTHQIRREPAEEVRGHRQRPLLRRVAAVALAGAAGRRCCSGSSRACASSASTIRTPSRSRSGSG